MPRMAFDSSLIILERDGIIDNLVEFVNNNPQWNLNTNIRVKKKLNLGKRNVYNKINSRTELYTIMVFNSM